MCKKLALLATLVVALFATSVSFATSIIPSDLEQMSEKAGKIFHGRCTDVKTIKDENGIPSTVITYDVIRGSKGVNSKTVNFKIFGTATRDGSGLPPTIRGINQFYPGKEDVLFLYKESEGGFTTPIGIWQGDFPVIETEDGPKLNISSKSYQKTINNKVALMPEDAIPVTPDDLLDKVELLLANH